MAYIPLSSGWQDSNLRPPAPKAGAITGYATPRTVIQFPIMESACKSNQFSCFCNNSRETGFEPGTRLGYACLANKSFRPLRHLSNVQWTEGKKMILMLRIKKWKFSSGICISPFLHRWWPVLGLQILPFRWFGHPLQTVWNEITSRQIQQVNKAPFDVPY